MVQLTNVLDYEVHSYVCVNNLHVCIIFIRLCARARAGMNVCVSCMNACVNGCVEVCTQGRGIIVRVDVHC